MARHGWGTDRSVRDWLFDEAYRFDFFQAVRLLESIYPERAAVGGDADPSQEVVRFTSRVALGFAASDVHGLEEPEHAGAPVRMNVNFMGLAGVGGPLPYAYTEMVIDRLGRRDRALAAFLDIFNHRLVSLMYRSRRRARVELANESPEQTGTARYLFSLMGLGTEEMRGRSGVDDRALLNYTSILAQQPRTVAGLRTIVAHFFGVPVESQELVGRWLTLGLDQQTAIGSSGRNATLGVDAVLGSRSWDQSGGLALRLGPLSYRAYCGFLPGGPAAARLVELTRFYVGGEYDVDIELVVDPADVPGMRLGASSGARLGWTSWLRTGSAPVALRPLRKSLDALGGGSAGGDTTSIDTTAARPA